MKQYLVVIFMGIMGMSLTGCELFGGEGDPITPEQPVVETITCTKDTPSGPQSVKGSLAQQEAGKDNYKFVIIDSSGESEQCAGKKDVCAAKQAEWAQERKDNGWSCS